MGELALSEADNGGDFTLHVGDPLVLALAENAAAGYRWTTLSLDNGFVELEDRQYQAAGDGVGSAGVSVWRLRAKREGRTKIELKKVRPWEPADAAAERYSITVRIIG